MSDHKIEDAILVMLKAYQRMTLQRIHKHLDGTDKDITFAQARTALNSLQAAGQVAIVGEEAGDDLTMRPAWGLTSAGQLAADAAKHAARNAKKRGTDKPARDKDE